MATPEDESLLDEMNCALTDCASGNPDITAQGLNSAWLYEYAGRAEKYRLQLIATQEFINLK